MGTTWEVLSLLTRLEVLYLHGNNLVGKIPAELGNLKNLVSIDLSFNKLTGEIPASFANLTRLKLLNLFANELQGVLPEFVGYLSWKSYKHGKTISPESSLPTWARTVGC